MEPLTAALIAGATIALKDTASQAVKDAYSSLKSIVVQRYKVTSLDTLEKRPSSVSAQAVLCEELDDNPGINEDLIVLERAKDLTNAMSIEPIEHLDKWGFIANDLNALSDIIISNISGLNGGVKVRNITSKEGGIQISDIHGGKKSGK